MDTAVKRDVSLGRTIIFFTMILGIGGIFGLGFIIPVYLLSYLFPNNLKIQMQKKGDESLHFGVSILMKLQSWYTARPKLELPQTRGALFVSNHRSHLDAFILLANIPGVKIMAKRELFFFPLLTPFLLLSGQIPSGKGDVKGLIKTMNKIREKIKAGYFVHIFPETTRCDEGFDGLQSLLLLPFQMAWEENFLIYPLVIKNTDRVWPRDSVCLKSGDPLDFSFLPVIEARSFESASDLREYVKQVMLQELTVHAY
jgi:1-acyl-sn-glycerol-3-phosphate acyltransferase